MDTHQQLVEAWKAKLEANSQPRADSSERFAWVRQIYTRIYQFLLSCYGEGEWRGSDFDSSLNASQSTASRMPFVEFVPPSDGLLPKTPERIRAALESIHGSNPGIATAGTMRGIEDDSWVVVDARKKSKYARAVYRRLIERGIEACLLDRTTDMAVVVRHEDFPKAREVVQTVGRARRVRNIPGLFNWSMEPGVENAKRTRRIRISKRVDPVNTVSVFLLISSVIAFLAVVVFFYDRLRGVVPPIIFAMWVAGLISGWFYLRGRR